MIKRVVAFFLIFTIISISEVFSKNILSLKKAAKVGDEVILQDEVEDLAKKNNIDNKTALELLINRTLLFIASKMYVPEPTEEMINEAIKVQKNYYASIHGKDVKNVTDEEFLAFLHYNGVSMVKYRSILKRSLWIKNMINKMLEQESGKPFNPTDKEIEDYIANHPEDFEEKEGVLLSMIYFSYYNSEQNELSKEEKEKVRKRSDVCFSELLSGADFEDLVSRYSDDLISKNAQKKGRVGYIYFDDPKVQNSFSSEILSALKIANIGVINKIFETKNGLYIFKINEKVKPQKLSKEQTIIRARDILKRKYSENLYVVLENRVIEEMKKKVIIIMY